MEGKEGENDFNSTGDPTVGSSREAAVPSMGAPSSVGQNSPGSARADSLQERGGIVTARGTVDGLVIRLDGRVGHDNLKSAVVDFLKTRKGFVAGNEVALEWVASVPEESFVDEISALLNAEFAITVRSSELWEPVSRTVREDSVEKIEEGSVGRGRSRERGSISPSVSPSLASRVFGNSGSPSSYAPSLFDGIEGMDADEEPSRPTARGSSRSSGTGGLGSVIERSSSRPAAGNLAVDAAAWDDPDARIIYGTLRSGQKIETEHSLMIFGDVNSGAELVAGGDIFVLGNLRGIAHAGAYDETGGGRVIFALNLQPTQLRIGMTISRGSTEGTARGIPDVGFYPEIARVEGNLIVVEPFSTRPNSGRPNSARSNSARPSSARTTSSRQGSDKRR